MTKRQNIENFKSRAIWTVLAVSVLVILVLAIQRKRNLPLDTLNVYVQKIEGNRDMISKKDVETLLLNKLGYDLSQLNIAKIDLAKVEEVLEKDSRVKEAEVYLDAQNNVNIVLSQRQPVVRIAREGKMDYYLDEDGKPVRVKKGAVVRVPVATGNINGYKKGFLETKKKSALKNVFIMCQEIHKDKFLSSLVEQIHVKSATEMYIIPKVGRQRISVDPSEGIKDKLKNLKVFYKDGLPRSGWSKFTELKIDYKDQVVGVKD